MTLRATTSTHRLTLGAVGPARLRVGLEETQNETVERNKIRPSGVIGIVHAAPPHREIGYYEAKRDEPAKIWSDRCNDLSAEKREQDEVPEFGSRRDTLEISVFGKTSLYGFDKIHWTPLFCSQD